MPKASNALIQARHLPYHEPLYHFHTIHSFGSGGVIILSGRRIDNAVLINQMRSTERGPSNVTHQMYPCRVLLSTLIIF